MIVLSGRGRTRDQHSPPDENQIRCQQQLCSQLQCVISLDAGAVLVGCGMNCEYPG